jgi:outer membrane protein assembly factor BamB
VIVNTLFGRVFAIDRQTQAIVWQFTAAENPQYTPAGPLSTLAGPEIYGDIVYVDGGDAQIHALNAATGAVIWNGLFGNSASRDLLVTDRRIIFPTGGELHVLDRETGSEILVTVQPHTSDPLFASAAAFSNGLVFVTVADAALCFAEP